MPPTVPPPGSFGLSVIGGRTGFWVGVGQSIVDRRKRRETTGRLVPTHAFFVVDGNMVVEAEPGGAILSPVSKYLGNPDVYWCDAPVIEALAAAGEDRGSAAETLLRRRLAGIGRSWVGTPYSFLDYLSIGLHRFGIRFGFIERYIRSSHHAICSQVVDAIYHEAGLKLFTDGRLSEDVTPGDLDDYRREHSLRSLV